MARKWSTMLKRRLLLTCLVATATVTLVFILRPSYRAITIHSSTTLGKSTVDKTLPKAAGEEVSIERYDQQERENEGVATRPYGSEHGGGARPDVTKLVDSVTTPYATQEHEEITTRPYTAGSYVTPQHERIATRPFIAPERGKSASRPSIKPEHKEITTRPFTAGSYITPQQEEITAAPYVRKHESPQFVTERYDPTESVKVATDRSAHNTGYSEEYGHAQYVTEQREEMDDRRASPVTLVGNPAVPSPPISPIIRIPKNKFSEYIATSIIASVTPSESAHSKYTDVPTRGSLSPSVSTHSENSDVPTRRSESLSVSTHSDVPTRGSASLSASLHIESTDISERALASVSPSANPAHSENTGAFTSKLASPSPHPSNGSRDMLFSGLASPSVFTLSKKTNMPTSGLASHPHSESTDLSASSLASPNVFASSGDPDILTSGLAPSASPRSGLGYALTFTYFDQLTAAAVNLLSLMCLTTKFGGVRVVEPFVVNSDFGLNASKKWTEQLKFRDINDISVWTNFVSAKHYNQFVPYETFMQDAPRKVLLVQYYYPCGDQTVWNMAREFCDSNGFELVGKVCLRYGREKTFTVNMLRNQIYSHFKRTDVVVLFEIYGGIEGGHYTGSRTYRLYGRGTKCDRYTVHDHYKALHPSPSVFSDAKTYIERYLNGSSSYISLMVRLERILRYSNGWNSQNSAQCSRQCLNNILKKWRDIKQRTGIATTFLAIDVGVYGSNEFHIHPEIEHPVLPPVKEFFSELFDNKTSLQEWEDTFSSVGLGQSRNSGYIAMMQKVVAVRGNVLMLVGAKSSSAFQTTGRRLYHNFHGKGQIIELNKRCS